MVSTDMRDVPALVTNGREQEADGNLPDDRDVRPAIGIGFFRVCRPGGMFHNIRLANGCCSSKAKMSALSKVEMSVSPPSWEFGGCHFDGHGGDEQARAEPS